MPKQLKEIGDPEIEAEIARLKTLNTRQMREEWAKTFRRPPPAALTRDLLGRMIAYRIQEKAYGGLDKATVRLLDRYARGQTAHAERLARLKTGTVVVREYRGELHTVTVVPDGFIWREKTYPTLSTIAYAITGTKWNGYRFFGLKLNASDKQASDPPKRRRGRPRKNPIGNSSHPAGDERHEERSS